MFTGLVECTGTVTGLEPRGAQTRLRVAPATMRDFVPGESIAVSGACLTVETFGQDWFTAYASAETLRVTSLGALRTGAQVNLERALALGDRLGGHLVSGHVDCLAEVAAVRPAGESRIYRIAFPAAFGPQVIAKGSVALDGVSLTVNACGGDWLEVNVIPETQRVTTIAAWAPGRRVNMETDLIGKYVQRMLGPWAARAGAPGATGASAQEGAITEDFLRRHGF
jgi:riboflavin synthase